MRRVRRFFFNFLSAASLVLCVATVVLWVRSYWAADVIAYCWTEGNGGELRHGGVESSRGRVWVGVVGFPRAAAPARLRPGWIRQANFPHGALGPVGSWRRLGFGVGAVVGDDGVWMRSVSLPLWFIAAALITPTAWRLLARPGAVRRERLARGLCLSCGYDLRASGDRCPECGEPIPGRVRAA